MGSANESSGASLSILMLPWLAHGHISPFLELAKRLSKRNITTYICSTPVNLKSIDGKITEEYSGSIKVVEIHLPSLPNLPPHLHTTNGLPFHLMSTLKDAFEMAAPEFDAILRDIRPDILLFDFCQPWAGASAASLGIPAIFYSIVSAVFLAYGHHMAHRPAGEPFPFPEIDENSYGIAKFRGLKGHKDEGRAMEVVERSSFVLAKSFRELEGKYMDYSFQLTGKRVLGTGPLVQESSASFGNDEKYTEMFDWLDKKEKSSAIFVSFGSEYFLSHEERAELAKGLELSNVNFIWVVRFADGENFTLEEALPVGFLQRVGDRGLIVEKWAPQAKILKHPNTGGFLSHCGWGSVMESLKIGVPIIAMPMHIDQPFNAKLVQDVGVGMEIVRDENGVFRGEEIAHVIKKVVVEKSGEKIKEKVKEMSCNIEKKGEEEIDELVTEFVQLCKK